MIEKKICWFLRMRSKTITNRLVTNNLGRLGIRSLLIVILLFFSLLSDAQFNAQKYDKMAFLVGSLDEFEGYQRTFTADDDYYYQRVDIYTQEEIRTTMFVRHLFLQAYPDIYVVNNGVSKGIKLYSPKLSDEIDRYYNFNPSDSTTNRGDAIYTGTIKKEELETEKQKLSFLLGAFLRYGITYQDFYLSLPASPDKAKLCAEILKDCGCSDVEYIVYEDYVPVGHKVYFKPSANVKNVMNEAERLRKYIERINVGSIVFSPKGKKFIWKDPPETPLSSVLIQHKSRSGRKAN